MTGCGGTVAASTVDLASTRYVEKMGEDRASPAPCGRTFAEVTASPPHRSFWRQGLARRACGPRFMGPSGVDDWLIAQANARGFFGAWVTGGAVPVDDALTLEEIVVGLSAPHAEADGRVFKLILRILQSGRVNGARLHRLARMERAEGVLHWLCAGVPESERTPPFEAIAALFAEPPRGYQPPAYRYDFARLVRRPFRQSEAPWNRSRGS